MPRSPLVLFVIVTVSPFRNGKSSAGREDPCSVEEEGVISGV